VVALGPCVVSISCSRGCVPASSVARTVACGVCSGGGGDMWRAQKKKEMRGG
jgi:hypothetical protein